jgi:hypothetical protein
MTPRRWVLVALLVIAAVMVIDPFGDGDCSGAPCQEGFLWRIWVAVAIVVLWVVAFVWVIVSAIRARRRH